MKKTVDWSSVKEFELKQVHLDLLKNFWIEWDDCEFGAPCVDCKRCYGNSNVVDDITEIIKLPKKENWDFDEETWNEEASDMMIDLHKQTQVALQIVLRTQSFRLGKYKKKESYSSDWVFVGE